MISSINFCPIKFNKDIIVNGFKEENYVSPQTWMTHKILNKEDVLSKDFINFLSILELSVFINLFYGPPKRSTYIHVDNNASGWALNYAWGSNESIMNWYSVKKGNYPKRQLTTANTPYWSYELDQVELIESQHVNGLCLVKTNVPHAVHNFSADQGRWCLSIRSYSKDPSFDSILEKISQL